MSRDVRRVPIDFEWKKWEWLPVCEACGGAGQDDAGVDCPVCDGRGVTGTPEQVAAYEVPEGEGWQVWEGVSTFGAPITPVLPTSEALVDYLVKEGTHDRYGDQWDPPFRRSAAEAFVQQGSAASLFKTPSGEVLWGARDADRIPPPKKGR